MAEVSAPDLSVGERVGGVVRGRPEIYYRVSWPCACDDVRRILL